MSQKIKSITPLKFQFGSRLTEGKAYSYEEIKIMHSYTIERWGEQALLTMIENSKERGDVAVEYEKPTILKRPDGSVISGLEEGGEICVIVRYRTNTNQEV
jgi:hypothetical protein